MMKLLFTLLVLFFSVTVSANEVALIEHVNSIFSSVPELGVQRECLSRLPEKSQCSSVVTDYMVDREDDSFFTWLADGNPKELCTAAKVTDPVFINPDKLDEHYQSFTSSLIPQFNKFNKGCLNKWNTLSDQRDVISFYYYGQTRILSDGLSTLNSIAALDAKLGEPVLEGVNCEDSNRLSPVCNKLKSCGTESGLKQDVEDTKMAMSLIEAMKDEEDEEKKFQVEQGLYRLYPWLQGKEFKANLNKNKLSDDSHIEKAIKSQYKATRDSLKKRIAKNKKLSACLEGRNNNCDKFKEELSSLVKAPVMGDNKTAESILGKHYINQQSCMQKQYETKKSADDSVDDFAFGAAVTVGTMGLGSIAAGTGILFKGTVIGSTTVRNANLVRNAARLTNLGINGSLIASGAVDAKNTCQNELNKLQIYQKLKGQVNKVQICPVKGADPHYQLMADYKACLIAAAFVGLDFLPISGLAIVNKFRKKPAKPTNEKTLEEHPVLGMGKPAKGEELQGKGLDPHYIGEEKGIGGFAEQNKEWTDVKTVYLDGKEREMHRMFVIDGKLYDSKGLPITIKEVEEITAGIYVMDKKGNFYWRNNGDVGEFHHSSFLAGEEVAGAGIFKSENGVMTFLSNGSGHYKPESGHLWQTIHKLMDADVDMDKVRIAVERKPPPVSP